MRSLGFHLGHISIALFAAIVFVSAIVLLREHITIFGSWLVTISSKKLIALVLFYLLALAGLISIGGKRTIILASLALIAASIFSASSDFYSLRTDGNYSTNGNSYVYRNNDFLYDKQKIRLIKSRAQNVRQMWRAICQQFNSFCSDDQVSAFSKLEKVVFIVSAMFDMGNAKGQDVERAGCIGNSEETNFESGSSNFSLIRKSSIGCCDDFAHLTASFLNYLGLENQFVAMPGHIVNRVRIGGKWILADANSALIIVGFDENRGDAKTFFIYPIPDVDLVSRRFIALNLQRQEISYFSSDVHFIKNFMTFPSSASVDADYLR